MISKKYMRPWFFSLAIVFLCIDNVYSTAVMSVDLGSEWMKIAVVSPGVPMEIALNVESKRKTATAVSIRDGERSFGSEALNNCVRYPKSCYTYFLDLLGKPFDHPLVKDFEKRFPYYDLEKDPKTGTVLFRHDQDTVYSPEELMAMVLSHAKLIAEEYTEQKIKDAVITVPVYFNQAERRALRNAGKMAKLEVLQLISEPMAVSLNYGMFRRKEINDTVKNLIFYDMGAQDTTVSIVAFQNIKTKERGFTETFPQAQIIGIAYDRTLGGLDLQLKIRDFLAEKFNEMKKTKTDVRTVPRAMGKLFKEAGRVKNVLSANTQLFAQVENVMEDIDFKVPISRQDFYEMCPDYFERVTVLVEKALKNAGDMKKEEVSEVILVGAGTRVPKVQQILTDYIGAELGKNLNTDEAAAMGSVYKAADLSTGFKVKKFITKEAVVLPIDVDFIREFDDDNGVHQIKHVKRTLFAKSNPYPQKKIMTFNKFTDDFKFNVNFNNVEYLGEVEIERIGGLNLTEVEVKGVKEAMEKHVGENIESKGVKAHFTLDDSGLLSISAVEAVFEKTISVEEQEAAEKKEKEEQGKEDNTWSKLGDTITSFFGDGNQKEDKNDDKSNVEGKNEDKKENSDDGDDKKEDKKKKDDQKQKDAKKEDKKKEEKKPKKPKIEVIKEPLEFEETVLYMPPLSEDVFNDSVQKLQALDEKDAKRKAQENAMNALESFVIDMRDKIYQELYEKSSTEEERQKILEKLSEVSDWIDEEAGPFTETEVLTTKLKELTDMTASLFARVREHTDRPEALQALNNMLNSSTVFLGRARNNTGDDGLFTAVELDLLEKKLNEIKEWKENAEKEQDEQPMYEMPKMTASIIAEKGIELDREVKYLISKAKIAKAEKEKERRKKEMEEKLAKEKKKTNKENKTEEAAEKEANDENSEKLSENKSEDDTTTAEEKNMDEDESNVSNDDDDYVPPSESEGVDNEGEEEVKEDIKEEL